MLEPSSVPPVPELLAPASSVAIAAVAFDHGADAVYVGASRLSLRAQAEGFSPGELGELCVEARARGKRVYAALNLMPNGEDIVGVREYLQGLAGGDYPDALIVSDPGVVRLCRAIVPQTELHLSTQSGVCNREALAFWAEQGVRRVVAPRELKVTQIAELCDGGLCELEVFVHGAMCMSVSGRCLLDAYLTGRHANRGDCSQPCRLRYQIAPLKPSADGDVPAGEWLTVEQSAGEAHLLNSMDLCALPVLPALIQAGVRGLKIEGRTKSEHYVATVTKVYRAAIDAFFLAPSAYTVRQEWTDELDCIEHRPYTTGFYGDDYHLQAVHASKAPLKTRLAGIVKAVMACGDVVVDVRNTFVAGRALQVAPVGVDRSALCVTVSAIRDMDGATVERATANRVVRISTDSPLRVGDMLRLS